jgi:hypothetical protein
MSKVLNIDILEEFLTAPAAENPIRGTPEKYREFPLSLLSSIKNSIIFPNNT